MFNLLLAIYIACSDSALYPATHCQMVAPYGVTIIVYIDMAIIQVCGICDCRTMASRDGLM